MVQLRWARFGLVVSAVAAAIAVLAVVALAAPSGWLAVDGNARFNPAGGASFDWANSGVGPPTGTCPAGAVDVGGTGGLFNCGRPGAAGAPPIAPTLTPAAAADPSIISAVFIVDPIAGDTTPGCPVGDPTTLNGGKNGDAINSYAYSTGPVPAKDDLSDVYAVSHTQASGHPEIYFGAERLVNNGDSHMDFEFLQSTVALTGDCNTGGNFVGHRTQGDLLVAVDFTGGGALAGDSVYLWHCAADPGPQPADGTVCDPAGGPEHYQLIAAPAFTSFTVNAAPIPCGGWVCRDQISGNSTTISTNDFLEGGVDLGGIPFTGCFNTFLPHTRTAQSFTSVLKDFAGPVGFRSCRNPATSSTSAPTGGSVGPGTAASDAVTVGNGGAGPVPTGTITFFLCGPAQVAPGGCPAGGTQVGAIKTLTAGAATSDPTTATTAAGMYCWRTDYAPGAASAGIYAPASHTNATTECFGVVSAPALPNTGIPALPPLPAVPPVALILLPIPVLAVAWRRGRSVAAILAAGVIAGSSPGASTPLVVPHADVASYASISHVREPASAALQLATVKPRDRAWRLVIPRIGVEAHIEPVGLDAGRAVAAPETLENVGWFNDGPLPGQSGDAILDGHFGLPGQPGVFRDLSHLRVGDPIQVIRPDGEVLAFHVTSASTVGASTRPSGLFSSSGRARLALITCSGTWQQSIRTYTDRFIVNATAD
jgi:sortase (surface protein transpeptidase)